MGNSRARSRSTTVGDLGAMLGDHRREVGLLGVLFVSTFSTVSLLGYNELDPTPLHPYSDALVTNPCGPVGALVADGLLFLLGHGAWLTFVVMVLTVLGIAGRRVMDAGRAVALAGLVTATLAMLQLLLGQGDAYDPGGAVGAVVGAGLRGAVGLAGAWLVLVGIFGITATILFQIRWGSVASRSLGAGEQALAWTGHRALSALMNPLSSAGAKVVASVSDSVERMGSSLTRREDESEPWTVPSELESLPQAHPDDYTPGSYIDTTQVNAPEAVVEVQWVPTDNSGGGEGRPSEVLQMFPDLSPRDSSPSSNRAPLRGSLPEPGPGFDPDNTGLYRDPPTAPSLGAVPVKVGSAPRRSRSRSAGGPSSNSTTPVAAFPRARTPRKRPAEPQSSARVQKAAFLDQHVDDDGGAVGATDGSEFQLPKLSLLDPVPPQHAQFDSRHLEQLARQVEETLASFKVTGKVTDVRVGPVVTTFEFLPDKGISVRKVASLQDDLVMGLRALSVRIVAPIPGKGVVGIEVPSEDRLTIYLREMLASAEFREHPGALPIVLGKDVEGAPVVADLAKMPHLLVGGTTGSGKSVGVNGMLLSLLFRKTPEELRLLLVDPKKLEFKMYEDIPHLLHPVVTEPKQAAAALSWACREMDARYEVLARWDCRNIAGYNRKIERELRSWNVQKARRYAPTDWPEDEAPPVPERMPYIVVVIDELADLMLVARKDVEGSIARLTQMARACGIHLIVATQRPSVDVVTGLIKSNLPTRISFKLRSGTDSRTILDSNGADTLLGRGDMLYLPNAGDLVRVHGPFASDEETMRVLDFVRQQAEPEYLEGVVDGDSGSGDGLDDAELDELFQDAFELCIKLGKASTSMIQRHLKIGYNRAARIVDQMEARGIVGPADGARPREVLVSGTGP